MKHDNKLTYEIKKENFKEKKNCNLIYSITEPSLNENNNDKQITSKYSSNIIDRTSFYKHLPVKNHEIRCTLCKWRECSRTNFDSYSISQMSYELVSSNYNTIVQNELLKKDIDTLSKELSDKNKRIENLSYQISQNENKQLRCCRNDNCIFSLSYLMQKDNKESIKLENNYQNLEKEYKEQIDHYLQLKKQYLELKEKEILKDILEQKLIEFENKLLLKEEKINILQKENEELIKKIEELTSEIKRVKKKRVQLNNYICCIESNFHKNTNKQFNYNFIIQCFSLTLIKEQTHNIKQKNQFQKTMQFSLKGNSSTEKHSNNLKLLNENIESYYLNPTITNSRLNCFNRRIVTHSKIKQQKEVEDINEIYLTPFDNNTVMSFNYKTHRFTSYSFADYSNYSDNFVSNNTLFHSNKGNMYIITGKSADQLYYYSYLKNSIVRQCQLNDNHLKGKLIYIPIHHHFVCLSGCFNKKVEQYDPTKNQWEYLPEMLIERCESSYLIINNDFIYSFFGYNHPTNRYLQDIEYLSYSKSDKWNMMKISSIQPIKLKGQITFQLNQDENKVIIVGGETNEDEANLYFAEIDIEQQILEYKTRQFKDIVKNKRYTFTKTLPINVADDKESLIALDDQMNIHWLNNKTLLHDVFLFNP